MTADDCSFAVDSDISDQRFDILTVHESWITSNAPPAIKKNDIPAGYTALHVHSQQLPDGTIQGGRLVISYYNLVVVRDCPVSMGSTQPSSFELQIVQIMSTKCRSVMLCNSYRSSRCSIAEFFDEFTDIVLVLCTSSYNRLLLFVMSTVRGLMLLAWFSLAARFSWHRTTLPTCSGNILHILVTDTVCLLPTWPTPVASRTTDWSTPTWLWDDLPFALSSPCTGTRAVFLAVIETSHEVAVQRCQKKGKTRKLMAWKEVNIYWLQMWTCCLPSGLRLTALSCLQMYNAPSIQFLWLTSYHTRYTNFNHNINNNKNTHIYIYIYIYI